MGRDHGCRPARWDGGYLAGNPVACTAALAVIRVMEQEQIPTCAAALGKVVKRRMEAWSRRHPAIGDVRGLGWMVAMELVKDPVSKEPDAAAASRVLVEARERGISLLKAGVFDNVIRVVAALTITASCTGRWGRWRKL